MKLTLISHGLLPAGAGVAAALLLFPAARPAPGDEESRMRSSPRGWPC